LLDIFGSIAVFLVEEFCWLCCIVVLRFLNWDCVGVCVEVSRLRVLADCVDCCLLKVGEFASRDFVAGFC
jgi:hypothetical protein